jgi:ribosomal protein S18 acetylase RimI-like enzyme
MTIRQATIEDINQLSILFDQYRVFYQQPSDIQAATTFLTERFNNNESLIFVAEEGQTLVGFTQLYPVFSSVGLSRTWVLNDMYVSETARGSGAADALLQKAQEMGTEQGCRWMMLQTATDNQRAQRVYERNGWKKDEAFFTYYFYPKK